MDTPALLVESNLVRVANGYEEVCDASGFGIRDVNFAITGFVRDDRLEKLILIL